MSAFSGSGHGAPATATTNELQQVKRSLIKMGEYYVDDGKASKSIAEVLQLVEDLHASRIVDTARRARQKQAAASSGTCRHCGEDYANLPSHITKRHPDRLRTFGRGGAV